MTMKAHSEMYWSEIKNVKNGKTKLTLVVMLNSKRKCTWLRSTNFNNPAALVRTGCEAYESLFSPFLPNLSHPGVRAPPPSFISPENFWPSSSSSGSAHGSSSSRAGFSSMSTDVSSFDSLGEEFSFSEGFSEYTWNAEHFNYFTIPIVILKQQHQRRLENLTVACFTSYVRKNIEPHPVHLNATSGLASMLREQCTTAPPYVIVQLSDHDNCLQHCSEVAHSARGYPQYAAP